MISSRRYRGDDGYKDEVVEFLDCQSKEDSGLALLIVIEGKAYWIPKSTIDDNSEVYRANQQGKFIIKRWMAEKKGLV